MITTYHNIDGQPEEGEQLSTNTPLDWNDIKASAVQFAKRYKDVKKEESYKQIFWTEFLAMFGIDSIEVGMFEVFVKEMSSGKSGEIDYFWPGVMVIEHKSAGKNLDDAVTQAVNYITGIEDRKKWPEYIIVSDFKRIRLMNTNANDRKVVEFLLEDLPDYIDLFGFLAGYKKKKIEGQHPVNIKAAEAMGDLYDMLNQSNYPSEYLDTLLIRLVFCMFAEDSDLFEARSFKDYLTFTKEDGSQMAGALTELFEILNTPLESRQKSISAELMKFPYVNGGLFAERIPGPNFNREMKNCLMKAIDLDWKFISPAIFGSLFQCVMDPDLRREMGAHYTSEENILKVIRPLFLDDLRKEYEQSKGNNAALKSLIEKMSKIKILDPACGCGNFLIISYRELKELEMDIFESLYGEAAIYRASRITVDNFYGIEYEKFPAQIAQVAMWLMEHLMNLHRMKRFGHFDSIIPLKKSVNIYCGNSLTKNWSELVSPNDLTYIIGNPPFYGSKLQTDEQRRDMQLLFKKNAGILDYVSAWYVKAANYMQLNPLIKTAYVSTNSITQGEQVEPLWKPLIDKGIHINFAYPTFKWSNEARGNAAVHVVIIGFSYKNEKCYIYETAKDDRTKITKKEVSHINAYLVEGSDIFISKRQTPLCDVPPMDIGCQPIDDGNYLFTKEEKTEFLKKEPRAEPYFYRMIGSKEYINRIERYCLWLNNCPPSELRSMPEVLKRVDAVRQFRQSSKRAQTQKCADTPTRYYLDYSPDSDYVLVPRVSSERRMYVPIGFMNANVFVNDSALIVKNATPYHLAILLSRMHMVWMRFVCGRLEMRYRYSAGIVYNNYPWPNPTDNEKKAIEEKAQKVLKCRDEHADQTLADLYDPLSMPADLLKAHQELDKAVEKAYRNEPFENDDERISFLFDYFKKIQDQKVKRLC